jgi:hypothetical protein
MPNMHAQSIFGAKSMEFKILKPEGGGAPVEHDFELSGMAPFGRPREQKRCLYA